jgi:hypothetical protein
MTQKLIPRFSQLLPNKESRLFHSERSRHYGIDQFQTYNDWFYFIHIDPVLRWWHAIGMVIGTTYFVKMGLDYKAFGIGKIMGIHYLLGVFFFYVLPLMSHYFYDGGHSKSTVKQFHSTLIPVIHINFLTLTGLYDSWLRNFIKKYPFTIKAWELKEVEHSFFGKRH